LTGWLDSLSEVPGDPGTVRVFAHRLGGAGEALDGHGSRPGVTGGLTGRCQLAAAGQFASLSCSMAGPTGGRSLIPRRSGVLAQYAWALAQQVRAAAQQQLDQAKVEAGLLNVALPMFSGRAART
jgi:hypothetical protein